MISRYLSAVLLVFPFLFLSTAHADTSGLVKMTRDESGMVSLPIKGTDAYWVLLNDCYLDQYGHSRGSSVEYGPGKYGDIFFMQQFSGNPAVFAEKVFYMKLAGVRGCYGGQEEWLDGRKYSWWRPGRGQPEKERFEEMLDSVVTPYQAALALDDVYRRIAEVDPTFTLDMFLNRIPTDPGTTCPSDFTDMASLAGCLDLNGIHNQVKETYLLLNTYPMPRVTTGFDSTTYAIRKPFSTFTGKTSLAWVEGENTAVSTVYISVYPFVPFIQTEGLTVLDRLSLDFGLVLDPIGNTASERFKSADAQYMAGLGFDLDESFAIHAAYVISHHDDGHSDEDLALGISFDILNLIAKAGK